MAPLSGNESPTMLAVTGIRKSFPGTVALDGVNFDVRPGEIHALLGENGAGKSTLVKVLSGIIAPDEGRLHVNGREVAFHSVQDAFDQGIAVVHQELSLMPNFTVAENLCFRKPPYLMGTAGRLLGIVDRKAMRRRVGAAAKLLDTEINPNARVEQLSAAQRQIIEIIKALMYSAKIILLDEPTSSLPPDERHEVFDRLRDLRRRGVGIVFITHFLEEALRLSDRISVLRDGKNAGTRSANATTVPELVELMTGRKAGSVFPRPPATSTEQSDHSWRLQVMALASPPRVKDISFAVRPGEIVGLAGLTAAGRTETLEAIFGVREIDAGMVLLDGREAHIRSPRSAIRHGIALIPEDRQIEGLFPEHSVERNISVAAANVRTGMRVTHGGGVILDHRRIRQVASQLVHDLQIKTDSLKMPVAQLSGGNQQKVIIGRWLAVNPRVILADEPTRGVSIGSKIEIYRLFRQLAAQGTSIVLVSSEFEELIGLCNRILILRAGRIVKEIAPEGLDADALLHLVLAASED